MDQMKSQSWTMSDMQNFRASVEDAVSGSFRNFTLFTSNAPTSGPQLIFLMNILEEMEYPKGNQLSVNYTYQEIEAIRFSQAQATRLGI